MKGTPLTEQTYAYIVDHFALEERALLEAMRERAEQAGVPMIMIAEDQAKFVAFFLKAMKARRVLDVGTLFGYSATIMARAIGPEGEVITLEFDPTHARVARENFAAFEVPNVTLIEGPALDAMKQLESASFDFILIDADKPNYTNYLREALRLAKMGAVIAGDNALAWGKVAAGEPAADDPDHRSILSVQAFNEVFSHEQRLFSIMVAVGDGMSMGVVLEK